MPTVVDETYYKLLKVSSSASGDEIRKAYRKLSLIHHPDRQAAKVDEKGHPIPVDHSQFQEIQQAYECLSDPEKRDEYDRYGKNGGGRSGGMPDMDDLFEHMFGGGRGGRGMPRGGGGGGPNGQRQKKPQPARSSQVELAISMEDCYNGAQKTIQVERVRKCVTCKGSGARPNTKRRQCATCKGSGISYAMRVAGPFMTRQEIDCPDCDGQGYRIRAQDACRKCHGKKTTLEKVRKTFDVERGMTPGDKIVLRGEGDESPDSSAPGNLIIFLTPIAHPTFKLSPPTYTHAPHNLTTKLSLTLSESILGFHRLIIQHLDGRGLVVHQPAPGEKGWRVLKSGDKVLVKGEGMWKQGEVGDLVLEIEVEMPDEAWAMKIRDEKRALDDLERLLPNKRQDVEHPQNTKEVKLAEYVEGTRARSTGGYRRATESDEDEDEDEDEFGPSCHQQ
ncbi:BQ5605_C009g05697 [Microbotryum silenes-dioicae]|uniref:BQ5605_C009g05697 protein n=1 Tax=Microbotryum silenes-dioicae TaxID=796604 RepID=A0A2X0MDN1_9BASI|nr:BQ5605_C009g05697 [Microbotryum silenes-dioicae]